MINQEISQSGWDLSTLNQSACGFSNAYYFTNYYFWR